VILLFAAIADRVKDSAAGFPARHPVRPAAVKIQNAVWRHIPQDDQRRHQIPSRAQGVRPLPDPPKAASR